MLTTAGAANAHFVSYGADWAHPQMCTSHPSNPVLSDFAWVANATELPGTTPCTSPADPSGHLNCTVYTKTTVWTPPPTSIAMAQHAVVAAIFILLRNPDRNHTSVDHITVTPTRAWHPPCPPISTLPSPTPLPSRPPFVPSWCGKTPQPRSLHCVNPRAGAPTSQAVDVVPVTPARASVHVLSTGSSRGCHLQYYKLCALTQVSHVAVYNLPIYPVVAVTI